MAARRFLGLICLIALSSAQAAPPLLLLQESPLAGFSHHAGAELWSQLQTGDALELVSESDNPADAQALRVLWRGHTLGYLPRNENGALTAALRQGLVLEARIGRLQNHPNPRQRVRVEIWGRLRTN